MKSTIIKIIPYIANAQKPIIKHIVKTKKVSF